MGSAITIGVIAALLIWMILQGDKLRHAHDRIDAMQQQQLSANATDIETRDFVISLNKRLAACQSQLDATKKDVGELNTMAGKLNKWQLVLFSEHPGRRRPTGFGKWK